MSDPFIGEIRIFAGTYAPVGWSFCDGSVLPISTNQVLYSLIGDIYGGNGQTTFALPDLRGRLPVGQGQGVAMYDVGLGDSFGVESITLTQAKLPAHSHPFVVSSALANTTIPADASNNATRTFGTFTKVKAMTGLYNNSIDQLGRVQLNAATLNPSAGSSSVTAHSNLMPAMALNYIIATTGLYPSQG